MVQTAHSTPIDSNDTQLIAEATAPASGTFPMASDQARSSVLLTTTLFCIIGLFPLFFGGVHPKSYLSMHFIVCLATLVVLLRERALVQQLFDSNQVLSHMLIGLAIFVLYAAATPYITSWFDPSYPVVGQVLTRQAPNAMSIYRSFLAGGAIVFMTTLFIFRSHSRRSRLKSIIRLSAIGIALVGLGHWFYDNGLLFWTFRPDNVFTSPRARWPFVNANHLASYLIPGLFLLILSLRSASTQLIAALVGSTNKRSRTIQDLLIRRSYHSTIASPPLNAILLTTVAVAIIGTLSRGTWIGIVGGVVLALLVQRLIAKPSMTTQTQPTNSPSNQDKPVSKVQRRRRHSRHSDRLGAKGTDPVLALISFFRTSRLIRMAAVALLAVTVLVISLGERGGELFVNRIEYGLLHSLSDMRWQLLSDTIPMIKDHLFFGVGLGNWNEVYGRYATPLLAGMNAGYLHNDIVQLIAETGLIGALIMLSLAALVIRGTISLRHLPPADAQLVATTSGILGALLIALCFDFHLHIPAIAALFCVILGLHIGVIGELRNRQVGKD